jgi:hypothetical protein
MPIPPTVIRVATAQAATLAQAAAAVQAAQAQPSLAQRVLQAAQD